MNPLFIIGALGAGIFAGYFIRIFISGKLKQSLESQAKNIISEAHTESESIKREAKLVAKSEMYELRNKFEQEKDEKNKSLQKFEQRLMQKEENLDKRINTLEKRERELIDSEKALEARNRKIEEKAGELDAIREQEIEELSKQLRKKKMPKYLV